MPASPRARRQARDLMAPRGLETLPPRLLPDHESMMHLDGLSASRARQRLTGVGSRCLLAVLLVWHYERAARAHG